MNDDRAQSVTARVLAELITRPNTVWFVHDLALACGLSQQQVQRSVNYMRKSSANLASQIEVVLNGNAWRWHVDAELQVVDHVRDAGASSDDALVVQPTVAALAPPSTPPLVSYYEIGTYDGDVLLRDQQGRTWRAQQVELNGT